MYVVNCMLSVICVLYIVSVVCYVFHADRYIMLFVCRKLCYTFCDVSCVLCVGC